MKLSSGQNIEQQEENRDKIVPVLEAALGNLKEAREIVGNYLRELQKE